MMSKAQKLRFQRFPISEETKQKQRIASLARGARPPVHYGEEHWSFGIPTELHPNFKGYGFCPDCGKKLSRRTKTKCMRCMNRKPTTLLYRQIRNVIEYRQWRSDVFTRDNFTCQSCGSVGGRLQAHHIKSFSKIISDNKIENLKQGLDCQELWNINNGVTLCIQCHSLTANFFNKAKRKGD
jgi:5-methylcytosine-specific restriction endonuclease McrA